MNYENIIQSVGCKLISMYEKDGDVLCGCNGPYDDPETSVRNLSHLLVIASIEYTKFKKTKYLSIINKIGRHILSLKESNGIYRMRLKDGKDLCNGVIGHAWLIEGLLYAYKATQDMIYLEECRKIASLHMFQCKLGLWGRPLMGNNDKAIDVTLNHQLWYASSLFELNSILKDEQIAKQCSIFLDRLNKNFKISVKGRITHQISNRLSKKEHLKQIIKEKLLFIKEIIGMPTFAYKEKGYHLFNLMALAHIYKHESQHPFFCSDSFLKSVEYIDSNLFIEGLLISDIACDASLHNKKLLDDEESINIYGFPYNVTGFEIMYVSSVINNKIKYAEDYLLKQFELTYNDQKGLFGNRCHDKNTINYRIYEFYQYLETL